MQIAVDSLTHPGLDVYAKLTENQLRNRLEPEQGLFIAQTPKVIALALRSGCVPVSCLMEEGEPSAEGAALLRQLPKDLPVYTAKRALLQTLTGYALTRGMLSAMRRPALPALQTLCKDARRIAVLEGIADATNVGAIVRSAAALSLDAVVVSDSCCDPFNRRAVRVSMGTLFQIPFTVVNRNTWQKELRELGFCTAAMALKEESLSLEDEHFAAAEKLALVLGSEGWGLPDSVIEACDCTLRIPMRPGVDSLNVGAAAAVAFWQLGRRK